MVKMTHWQGDPCGIGLNNPQSPRTADPLHVTCAFCRRRIHPQGPAPTPLLHWQPAPCHAVRYRQAADNEFTDDPTKVDCYFCKRILAGTAQPKQKVVHYAPNPCRPHRERVTSDSSRVTCKTCLKRLQSPRQHVFEKGE